MKKRIAIIVALVALFLIPQKSFAQFGVKGGIYVPQYSKFKDYQDFDVKQNIGFQAGVAYQINILPVFTIQPELVFVQREAEAKSNVTGEKEKYKQQLIQIPVSVQYGIDLSLVRPFVQAVPYINYVIDGKYSGDHKWTDSNRFSYGIGLGAGVELWRFQLSVRYNWDISKIGGKSSDDPIYERYRVSKGKAFEVTLAYFF